MTQIEARESRWQRWGGLALPALTFLVGVVLGAVVILARTGGAGGGGAASDPAADPNAAPSSATASNADTVVTLPGACEDAAENITEATRLIDDVVDSVRNFQPDELVTLLNELEDLDDRTRPLAEECSRVDVSASESPSSSSSE